MIKKQVLSIALALGVLFSVCTPTKVMADSNIDVKDFIEKSELNKYIDDEKSVESLKELSKNAVSATSSEYYVRYVADEDNNVAMDPKKYTEEEYNEFKNTEEAVNELTNITGYSLNTTPERSNSWIHLRFESYKAPDGQYDFYIFYDWKNKPMWTGKDVISLGYTSNITVDTTSVRSHHTQLMNNPITSEPYYSSQDYNYLNNSNCKTDLNGIAFKFDLPSSPDTWPAFYNGYMTAKGRFSNTQHTSATMEMAYTHQQIGFAYNIQDAINFLTTGKVEIKMVSTYDVFRAADEFLRY
ncbi:hypothetical protein KPL40_19700 [Clostridium gasigenes]|uniref:hypothetical protein n=1 Tax=Clostridium gasigenes TaxID=94869 RepID=UPI001C0D51FF|nr:hypothetical protein [Clostridium gasigenes]MBU3134629.1 hypothetical protein [Clostridium gasigenes]